MSIRARHSIGKVANRFTEGRARALSGLDLIRLEQEKKKWRHEWELERGVPNMDAVRARQIIDDKQEEMRLRDRGLASLPLPPAGWRVGPAPQEKEPWDGIGRLKDEGAD